MYCVRLRICKERRYHKTCLAHVLSIVDPDGAKKRKGTIETRSSFISSGEARVSTFLSQFDWHELSRYSTWFEKTARTVSLVMLRRFGEIRRFVVNFSRNRGRTSTRSHRDCIVARVSSIFNARHLSVCRWHRRNVSHCTRSSGFKSLVCRNKILVIKIS